MLPTLNIDLGELPDEPDALFAAAQLANVACGGHAGDPRSMAEAVARCARYGVGVGAHPSYPDRAGFGRVALHLSAAALAESVAQQCSALAVFGAVGHIKPHGALYHACADPAVAEAVLDGAAAALGAVAVIGPPALLAGAAGRGWTTWREGFADRGVGRDGALIPRGQPGALLADPAQVAARALALVGQVDTVCVHGDTPGAVALAWAVRHALAAADGAVSRPPRTTRCR